MNLLQSGVDLTVIALWLGHERIETTHQYMEANLEMKRKALESLPLIGELPITSSNGAPEDIFNISRKPLIMCIVNIALVTKTVASRN